MQTWHLDPTPAPQPLAADSVALLLQAPQDDAPGATLLAFLNRLTAVDYLSLVEYLPQPRSPLAAPELVEGHARPGLANVTPDCFQRYRQWFWREDEGTRLAHQADRRGGGLAALHVQAEDIHVASWRSEIYDRAHLSARLSFFYEPVPGTTFSMNLYRDRSHGGFAADEIARLLAVAPLLRQAHRCVLRSSPAAARPTSRDQQVERAQATLRRKAPELSARELAVCARIACGISADGIAAELDVAPSTVITLRKRAYAKLSARGVTGGRLQLAAFLH
ncbi:LuxR family transcriptional regulator [Ramlibacter henchirensis]|uniref:LuxR family transcriptional regulator n=1 Tax=Ramlibacter henchirensis TaxID=204072 RepID=A0A4Z0BUL1_9BURK|nr:helix-turn-helix transcriptional regulator [Ramlibacter henchirensis]TFZ02996.1 LuxR family transcriptional regulator [Ramlibacter henchirensis]